MALWNTNAQSLRGEFEVELEQRFAGLVRDLHEPRCTIATPIRISFEQGPSYHHSLSLRCSDVCEEHAFSVQSADAVMDVEVIARHPAYRSNRREQGTLSAASARTCRLTIIMQAADLLHFSTHRERQRMDNEPWQLRAQAAGLEQKTLARLLGRPVNTISRQIRGLHGGVPQHLIAVIVMWERLSDADRKAWVHDTEREMRREHAKPPKLN